MFHLDRTRILDADRVRVRAVPTRACVELGIAYCQKYLQNAKLLLGLNRHRGLIGGAEPMVSIPLDYVVDDEETLLRLLAEQGSSPELVNDRVGVYVAHSERKGMV